MKREQLFSTVLAAAMIAGFSACQKSAAENAANDTAVTLQTSPSILPSPAETPAAVQNLNSPIRKIDFKNFTYPETEDYGKFTLRNGAKPFVLGKEDGIDLFGIEYVDLTGDGEDEAVLLMSVETGGSMSLDLVFVYAMKKIKPKLLWNFASGDRAEGGLKSVYAENDELAVETFGDNKFENDKWDFKFPKQIVGYCCPTAYTKIRFKWNGEKFVADGDPELFDYDYKKEQLKNQQK